MEKFREMRRKRQQLDGQQCIEILQKSTSGVLALAGDNGYPYALPISFVYQDNAIYFHSAMTGHKIDAINRCDKASFCIIDQDCVVPKEYTTYFRSVIVFGKIHIVEDDKEKETIARMLGNRYNPNDDESLQKELNKSLAHMATIRLDIEHMTGKEAIELVKSRENH